MSIWNTFNAAEVEPMQTRDVLPAGKYLAVITESATRPTKAGDGERLNFTFEILEGDHKGRKVWAGLNIKNKNPDAEKIAMRELSAICRAVGVLQPRGPEDLQDKPLEIDIKVRAADEKYPASNEIAGYRPAYVQAAPIASTTSKASPPWKK